MGAWTPVPAVGATPAERARNECAAQGVPFQVPMTSDLARWLRDASARLEAAS